MNAKKVSKIVSILMITIMLITVANIVLADNLDPKSLTGTTTGDGINQIRSVGQNIIGIVQVVGSIVAVVILVVLGIKYMMGSAEEKAEYKKTMIPYIIGAVLIFAASNLAGMIYGWAKTVGSNS